MIALSSLFCRASTVSFLVASSIVSLWAEETPVPAPAAPSQTAAAKPAPKAIKLPGIENAFQIDNALISGSAPEGTASFEALAKAGVKTIISVDGSKPDIEMAHKFGMHYVHLPFGYGGIPKDVGNKLVRAIIEADGVTYVHCHHGKHRGPAAVAIMCRAIKGWTPETATAWLKSAGTSPDYAGLFRDTHDFQIPNPLQLMAIPPTFPEIATTEPLVDKMVAIDEQFDLLKSAQKTKWKEVPGHTDFTPLQTATLLWEHFRELLRDESTDKLGAEYRTRLEKMEKDADALRLSLTAAPIDPGASDLRLKDASASCVECHKHHRN